MKYRRAESWSEIKCTTMSVNNQMALFHSTLRPLSKNICLLLSGKSASVLADTMYNVLKTKILVILSGKMLNNEDIHFLGTLLFYHFCWFFHDCQQCWPIPHHFFQKQSGIARIFGQFWDTSYYHFCVPDHNPVGELCLDQAC